MRTLPVTLVVPTLNGGRRFVQQLECLARSESGPQRVVVIDEHRVEVRRARGGQHRQCQVAQVAAIALVKNQGHTHASLVRGLPA